MATRKADEPPVSCPSCDKSRPMAALQPLSSWVWRAGRVVKVENTGDVVCCQACGHVFCMGPSGAFERHPEAVPGRAGGPPRAVSADSQRQPPPQKPRERAIAPLPKHPPVT